MSTPRRKPTPPARPVPAFHVVLVEPEIPPNTGNIGRLCLAAGARLHLVEPLGFSLDDRSLRRAGLDYWKDVDLRTWPSLDAFLAEAPSPRLHLLTTKAERPHWDARFRRGDFLVFGSESRGLPEPLLAALAPRRLTIPMPAGHRPRSLNLATAVGIVLWEALRQAAAETGPAGT